MKFHFLKLNLFKGTESVKDFETRRKHQVTIKRYTIVKFTTFQALTTHFEKQTRTLPSLTTANTFS